MTRPRRLAVVLAASLVAGCACRDRPAVPEKPDVSAAEADERPLLGLPADQARQVLARIDDRELTVLDFAEELAASSPAARARFVMPAHRAELLDRIVRDELLADEARRRGYRTAAEVVIARRKALVRLLAREVREELARRQPPEADLRDRYLSEPGRWNQPELAHIRALGFADPGAARTALRSLLRSTPNRLPRDFQQLAERHRATASDEEFGPFARPEDGRPEDVDVPEPLARAAFDTPAGQLHPEVVSHEGVHYVVWVLSVIPETRVTFEEARPLLVAELLDEAVARRLADLATAGRTFSIDDGVLGRIPDPFHL